MANGAPLIQLEAGGKAPVLRYDIPEPTSYEGKNFIELVFDDDIFSASAKKMPSFAEEKQLKTRSKEEIKAAVGTYLKTGMSRSLELPNLSIGAIRTGLPRLTQGGGPTLPDVPQPPEPPEPPDDDDLSDYLVDVVADGNMVVKGVGVDGEPTVDTVPVPTEPDPHLYLVESLRLTSFLGDYGAGRIVKTFTLLPGEVTRISVKTFRQRESTRKSASSVLDSLTNESATDLETSVMREQSDQRSFQKTKEYYADAEASAGWGWGSAKVSAGVKGSTNSAREESVKNVSNATEKHSSRASAKREVEINTSYEVSEKARHETEVSRDIENINLSRTLNFVFRQMNQEFITFLHLTDVRIGFFNGDPATRMEVSIASIDDLLEAVVKEGNRPTVRGVILDQLSAVRDRDGNTVDVVREVQVTPGDTYLQFDPDLESSFTDDQNRSFTVPGVLLKADTLVMRTEGVMVEALLGNGVALDTYAEELQELEVERRKASVEKDRAHAEQATLVNQVIADGDDAKGAIAKDLVCRCCCEKDEEETEPVDE